MTPAVNQSKNLNAENYRDGKRTVVEDHKLLAIEKLCNEAKRRKGDMAEVGVWRGGVGILLGECTKDTETPIYLFDTFEGIPFSNDYDNFHKAGDFGSGDDETSFKEVSNTLQGYKNISIYKGIFPIETAHFILDRKFSLVHIDVDVYQSYKECLEFFWPRMIEGGVIILDDYLVDSCEGCTKACDEFAQQNGLTIESYNGQPLIRI